MILSDTSIRNSLERDYGIEIEPEPTEEQIQPASLDVRLDEDVGLHPGQFELPFTKERIALPDDVAAMLTGRSSIGRQGVTVHVTAGWIDPGFDGKITMEMTNLGSTPRSFEEGERVAQLVFFPLTTPSEGYDGQYQHQGIRRR